MRVRALLVAMTAVVLALLGTAPAQAISEGAPAAPGQFPWLVRVLPVGCGGTLISPHLVLTAKHCIQDTPGDSFTVVSGVVDLEDPGRTTTASVATYAPPGDIWWDADWGLIKLAEPLDLPPLPIATQPGDPATVTAVGWGATTWGGSQQRYLHWVELPFLPDDQCSWTDGGYADRYLCAKSVDQRSTCNGDSGGPALHLLPDGSWEQVGIVSFGSDCDWAGGEEPTPVFTDVAFFAQDVERAARDLMGTGSR